MVYKNDMEGWTRGQSTCKMSQETALLFALVVCAFSVRVLGQDVETNNVQRALDSKGMLTSLANTLMSRGYAGGSGSQVVSLNLTNLLVLVLLKALIFAAGSLGAGTWKGGYGRSADGEEELITEEEILLYLSYLTGSPGNNGCLQNVACRRPNQAKRYTSAGEMLLKATKMILPEGSPQNEYILQELRDAVSYGASGGDCDLRFKCAEEGGR